MVRQFVKLPVNVLLLNIPAEAKLLYSILADKISYSKFADEDGRKYYYMSQKEKHKLLQMVGCKDGTYKKNMKILRDMKLIVTKQYGSGIRVYSVGYFLTHQVDQKLPHQEGYFLPHPLNHSIKTEQNKTTTDYSGNNINSVLPIKEKGDQDIMLRITFMDVLKLWKEKGYKSNPAKFYDHYYLQGWKINGEEVRNWKKLAQFWENQEFTPFSGDISKVSDELRQKILKDEKESGGMVRQETYSRYIQETS